MIERAELQDSARKAFGEGGLAPDAEASWQTLAEMGWFMMTVPEAQGGLGLGREALAAIHYELGRALVPGPAIVQMVAIEALVATGQADLLERAIAGEVVTLCLLDAPDADRASQCLMIMPDNAIALTPVAKAEHRPTWDETRRLFEVTPGAITELVAAENGQTLAERLQANMLLMIAADSLGGADAILDLTIDYLKTRNQFDRPLAMFQALKHRVADMKTHLAAAEALFWSCANDATTLVQMGALKAHTCRVYVEIAEEAIQLHGGIGLTAEHHCHLFLKRAMLNAALGGGPDHWEEQAGRQLLEGSAS